MLELARTNYMFRMHDKIYLTRLCRCALQEKIAEKLSIFVMFPQVHRK